MGHKLFSNRSLIQLIIPLVIEQGLTILVGMADGVMVASVGEAAISGVSLVDMIAAVILVLFAALATGGAVITSQFLGARNMEKARRSAGQLIFIALGLSLLIMMPCLLFSEQHASLAIIFWPVSFVLPNALRAANDVKFTMWVGIASMLICRILGSWVLCIHFGMGAVGVWIAMTSDWVFRTGFFVPRVLSGKWKTKYKPE